MPYYYGFRFTTRLVNGALTACFLGLIVVVQRCGWPDLGKLWRLLRLRPERLLSISLLASAASGGAWNLGLQALAWVGRPACVKSSSVFAANSGARRCSTMRSSGD